MICVEPYKPFHVGPTPGLPFTEWQATQPLAWASVWPCSANAWPLPPATPEAACTFAFWLCSKVVCCASQRANDASSSTTTTPRMFECPMPQSCAHRMS